MSSTPNSNHRLWGYSFHLKKCIKEKLNLYLPIYMHRSYPRNRLPELVIVLTWKNPSTRQKWAGYFKFWNRAVNFLLCKLDSWYGTHADVCCEPSCDVLMFRGIPGQTHYFNDESVKSITCVLCILTKLSFSYLWYGKSYDHNSKRETCIYLPLLVRSTIKTMYPWISSQSFYHCVTSIHSHADR